MSQISYYAPAPVRQLPHQGGLVGWGVTFIAFGGLAGLMSVITVLSSLVMMSGLMPRPAGQANPFSVQYAVALIGGAVAYALAATCMIWVGLATRKGRRWVRPVVMVASMLCVVHGLATIIVMISAAVAMFQNPSAMPTAPGLPAGFMPIMLGITALFTLLVYEVLPMVILWFFARSSVQHTLDILDPHLNWTDRCPLPVLIWCGACVMLGLGMIAGVLGGVLPFFSSVMSGLPAIALSLCLSASLLGGAYLSYRQNILGWAISVVAVATFASSNLVFAIAGDHARYYHLAFRQFTGQQRSLTEHMTGNLWWAPAALNFVALLYAFWLLPRFRQPVIEKLFPETV